MSQVMVYVDTDEVLGEISDKELLAEVASRKLDGRLEFGTDREILERALDRKDWEEVEYRLRLMLRTERGSRAFPSRRDPVSGRPLI